MTDLFNLVRTYEIKYFNEDVTSLSFVVFITYCSLTLAKTYLPKFR